MIGLKKGGNRKEWKEGGEEGRIGGKKGVTKTDRSLTLVGILPLKDDFSLSVHPSASRPPSPCPSPSPPAPRSPPPAPTSLHWSMQLKDTCHLQEGGWTSSPSWSLFISCLTSPSGKLPHCSPSVNLTYCSSLFE